MACDTGQWESILPDNATEIDDGTLFIDKIDGSGNIEGRHRPKDARPGDEKDIENGTCKNDKIEFDIVGFHYTGNLKGRMIKGRRRRTQNNDREEGVNNEEVWVGVKTA